MTDTPTALEALERLWRARDLTHPDAMVYHYDMIREALQSRTEQVPTPYQVENLNKLADRIWSQDGGMTGEELLANAINIMNVKAFGAPDQSKRIAELEKAFARS